MFSWFGFPEADHPELFAWFGDMLERTPGERALPAVALAARDRMRAYVHAASDERRAAPREDLMTFLVEANAAGQMTADELVGASLLLFMAGITTTSGLIWMGEGVVVCIETWIPARSNGIGRRCPAVAGVGRIPSALSSVPSRETR